MLTVSSCHCPLASHYLTSWCLSKEDHVNRNGVKYLALPIEAFRGWKSTFLSSWGAEQKEKCKMNSFPCLLPRSSFSFKKYRYSYILWKPFCIIPVLQHLRWLQTQSLIVQELFLGTLRRRGIRNLAHESVFTHTLTHTHLTGS